jgi:bla regulator protein BlaR1
MMLPALWNSANLQTLPAGFVNHLWQSTLVVAIAWLLTLALKRNHARTRYWIWMIASVKFLVPFSLFITAGEWIRSLVAAPIEKPGLATAMEQITQPFQQVQFFVTAGPVAAAHRAAVLPAVLLVIWVSGVLVFAARWARGWARIRTEVRLASPLAFEVDVPVRSSPSLLEPGVFGIFRPMLLLPQGIMDRLTPEQLSAIVAHEMCHVRRRDNLTYALHTAVEVVFWFYPPVRWIGTQLLEEREHACDEAVIEAGGEAQVYAEGILNVCKFYVESPVACAAGVTGSDLKKRIVRIMTRHMVHKLDLSRKLLLGAAGILAVALPLTLGLVRVVQVRAQGSADDETTNLPKFDVASVKPFKSGSTMMQMGMRMTPDGFSITGLPLSMLMHRAFGVSDDRILNEPGWVKSDRFDIEAKVDPADAPKLKDLKMEQRWAMMLPVLEERFGLKFHRETRDVQVYTLVITKGGAKMQAAKQPDPAAMAPGDPTPKAMMGRAMMRFSPQGMTLEGHGASMESLVGAISQQLGSTVVDKTGLTGTYDYTLNWMPEHGAGPMGGGPMMRPPDGGAPSGNAEPAPAETGPSIYTALQDQLGLKLVAQKEPVEVYVIDHIDQPSPN